MGCDVIKETSISKKATENSDDGKLKENEKKRWNGY